MSTDRAWMPLYIGDYLGDTRHLTTEEHGAYLLLIMAYWQQGGLPDDDIILARIAGVSGHKWRFLKTRVKSFFRCKNRTLQHGRIDAEISRATDKSKKAQKAAKLRWKAEKSDTDADADADAELNAIADAAAMLRARASPPPSKKERIIPTNGTSPAHAREAEPLNGRSVREEISNLDDGRKEGRSVEPGRLMRSYERIASAANFAPKAALGQAKGFEQVADWLRDGLDVDAEILPIVKSMVASSADTTSSLRRFDKAVRSHHAKREAEQADWSDERKADYAARLAGRNDPPRSRAAKPIGETLGETLGRIGATLAAKGGDL